MALEYKDLMVALLEASYNKNETNFYHGRKYIMSAKQMLNLDEAVLLEANKRNWEVDQLDAWVNSYNGLLAASNFIADGGNGFSAFFNDIKITA